MSEDKQPLEMRDLITHFRMKANETFPYLSPFVYQLDPVERPGLGTMAVDKWARLYYDPAFVETLTPETGAYVVLHEATHLILRHCHRVESIVGPAPNPQQCRRLNIAFDLVIWEFLEAIEKDAPKIEGGEPVTWHNMKARYPKLVRNMLPHEIYSIMLEQDEEQEKQKQQEQQPPDPGDQEKQPGGDTPDDSQPGNGNQPSTEPGQQGTEAGDGEEGDGYPSDDLAPINGGSAADGQPRDYEEAPNENWDAYQENELLSRVEKKIEALANENWQPGRGTQPLLDAVKCSIEKKLRPQPDPWSLLRAAVSKAVKANRGAREQTWNRMHRHQYAWRGAPRMQGEETYSPKAVVIIDTSGSMTAQCKQKCVGVVAQGLRAVGAFTVICGDVRVQSAVKVASLAKLEIPQGGGTDMRPLIKKAEEDYRPDVIVICTDGGTPWPAKKTKAQLIVALTQELPTPEWATRCRIPDPGKEKK